MSLININGLGIASPHRLFHNLTLAIHAGDRIGLIAGNGAGKSTLLRCIAGQTEAGSGEITRKRGLKIGYVEQDVPENLLDLPLIEAIRRALPPADREANAWRCGVALDMFNTPTALHDRPLRVLSGGWQRFALIARAWITEPDLLLLDEPTNHLDLDRLAVLEDWIRYGSEGVAMLIASHDRQFLDDCTTRTLFLRADISRDYAHPFSRARLLMAADDATQEAVLAKDAKEAQRLRQNAGRLKNVGINSGSDLLLKKSKQLNARAEAIEQALRPVEQIRSGEIKLSNRGTHAKVLVSLDNIAVTTPDGRHLFRTGALKIFQGDRIVITGANGVGKSQFVRMLREVMCLGGEIPGIIASPSAVVGYIDQQMSQLPADETAHGFIAGSFRLGDQRSLSLLASAGFDIDTQRRKIAQMSPGQKARLGLLALRLTEPNFYLMDEPTNHVDIAGQERLEDEIISHGATCVLVSHDRFFVRAIGTRVLVVGDGGMKEQE